MIERHYGVLLDGARLQAVNDQCPGAFEAPGRGGVVLPPKLRQSGDALADRGPEAGTAAQQARGGLDARPRLRRGGAAAPVDLDQVELVLLADVAVLVLDVEELGLAGTQPHGLALLGGRTALAVADRDDTVADHE